MKSGLIWRILYVQEVKISSTDSRWKILYLLHVELGLREGLHAQGLAQRLILSVSLSPDIEFSYSSSLSISILSCLFVSILFLSQGTSFCPGTCSGLETQRLSQPWYNMCIALSLDFFSFSSFLCLYFHFLAFS